MTMKRRAETMVCSCCGGEGRVEVPEGMARALDACRRLARDRKPITYKSIQKIYGATPNAVRKTVLRLVVAGLLVEKHEAVHPQRIVFEVVGKSKARRR